jgi:hypothetical protein
MARAKVADIKLFKKKPKKKRPNRHSKKGISKLKQSKLYKKRYKGQGK